MLRETRGVPIYGEGVMFYCLKTFIGEKALGQLSSFEGLWPCGCCLAKRGLEQASDSYYAYGTYSILCEKGVVISTLHEKMEAELGQVTGPTGRKKVESALKCRSVSKVLTPAGNKGSWELRLSEELILTHVLHPSSSSDHV